MLKSEKQLLKVRLNLVLSPLPSCNKRSSNVAIDFIEYLAPKLAQTVLHFPMFLKFHVGHVIVRWSRNLDLWKTSVWLLSTLWLQLLFPKYPAAGIISLVGGCLWKSYWGHGVRLFWKLGPCSDFYELCPKMSSSNGFVWSANGSKETTCPVPVGAYKGTCLKAKHVQEKRIGI